MTQIVKSTITSDLGGIIQASSDLAETLVGYKPAEAIRQKRVSIFSPGGIILQNVNTTYFAITIGVSFMVCLIG